MPDPRTLDYWRAGELPPEAGAGLNTGTFDYWRGGEPFPTIIVVAAAVQYVYPVSDVSAGGWTTDTGSSSNLYAAIDELIGAINDADYIQSPLAPNGAEAKIRLGTAAALATSHYQYVRAYNPVPNSKRIDLTITLYATDGTTVLDTTTVTLTSTPTTYALPIASAADAATGLVLGVSATQVG